MKKVTLINQLAGKDNLGDMLNKTLKDDSFSELCILVAYTSWEGIVLIHKELERFYDSKKKVSIILGVSDSLFEYDVLRYLIERYPKADIRVFSAANVNYEFHPKCYLFKGMKKSKFIVGSNNLTLGGLYSNSECSLIIEYDKNKEKKFDKEVTSLFQTYSAPHKPFSRENLKKIDQKFLSYYRKLSDSKAKIKKRQTKTLKESVFPEIEIILHRKERIEKTKTKSRTKTKKAILTLLLEVKKETGVGGTQVQIPAEVVRNFFKVSNTGHQTIEVRVDQKTLRPAVLCHFKNNTHRITFPEIFELDRPLILKMEKIEARLYDVSILSKEKYKENIRICDDGSRSGAKKWKII